MKIIFVRHGESEGNVASIINDNPARIVNLTEKGRMQAAAAGEALRTQRFTHAYVSEFARAQQTAQLILRHHACELQVDPRLNERRSGMDGLHVSAFNDLVRPDLLRIKPVGGESFMELMARVRSFLDEIYARHPQATVLAVSHENPILAALALTVDDPGEVAGNSLVNCERVELDWPVDPGSPPLP
jgi:alpha-ribazole phosphatase/probable phosphoglycerate mutase